MKATATTTKKAASSKPKAKKGTKAAKPKNKGTRAERGAGRAKLSALSAAAQVLANAKAPMNAKELVAAMAEQKLWTSPAGATPHATLYAAMIREIAAKGKEARFKRASEAGKFLAR